MGVFASVAALSLVAGVAAAQQPQYPPGQVQQAFIACNRTAARPGTPPFCRVGGFRPGSRVQVTLRGPVGGGQAAGTPLTLVAEASSALLLSAPALAQDAPRTVYRNTVTADAEGVASDDVNIPRGTTPGRYELTFSGVAPDGAPRVASTTLQVQAAAAREGRRGLPTTGLGLTNGLLLAAGVSAAGGGLLVVTRRRTRRRGGEAIG